MLEPDQAAAVERLVAMLADRRVVALTGAGCSTESGIPDYRGEGRRPRSPIQHDPFVRRPEVRQRYWARSTVGWPRFAAARPNAAHEALAALEAAGVLAGIITQNVDRLHQAAGSRRVVELHGALTEVRCLACDAREARAEVQRRLVDANPGWLDRAAELAPDGDADLPPDDIARFRPPECLGCGGALKPDVVFFGGHVAPDVVEAAWALFAQADCLLVVGSSLTVWSGYRFAKRAGELAMPVGIVNMGPTRADDVAEVRVGSRAGDVLPRIAARLGIATAA